MQNIVPCLSSNLNAATIKVSPYYLHLLHLIQGWEVHLVSSESYVYLGVTLTSTNGHFSMTQTTTDWFTRGYVAVVMHQAHSQESCTKVQLLDTMVTSTLKYCAAIWLQVSPCTCLWTQIAHPLLMMLLRMTHVKAFTPHRNIYTELEASPMMVDALFQTMNFINWIQPCHLKELNIRCLKHQRKWQQQNM